MAGETNGRNGSTLWTWMPLVVSAGAWVFTIGVASNRLERADTDLKSVRGEVAALRDDMAEMKVEIATMKGSEINLQDRVERIFNYLQLSRPKGRPMTLPGLRDPPSWGNFLLALLAQVLVVGVLWGAQYTKIQWLESDLKNAVEDKGKLWAKQELLQASLAAAQITLGSVQEIRQSLHEQEVSRDARADALNSALNNVASSVGDLRMTLSVQIERLNNVIGIVERDNRARPASQ